MLFKSRFHEPIRRGEITCTVRVWKRPHVRVGGRYALGAGSIEVDRIHEVELDAITPDIVRRSGFGSLVELLNTFEQGAGERVFLIEFHYIGAPVRRPVQSGQITDDEMAQLLGKLDAMDRRAQQSWTRETLRAIAANPGLRAADLAAELGRERDEFKRDVRKLKALGLTISLEVGYRLSERGQAILARAAFGDRREMR